MLPLLPFPIPPFNSFFLRRQLIIDDEGITNGLVNSLDFKGLPIQAFARRGMGHVFVSRQGGEVTNSPDVIFDQDLRFSQIQDNNLVGHPTVTAFAVTLPVSGAFVCSLTLVSNYVYPGNYCTFPTPPVQRPTMFFTNQAPFNSISPVQRRRSFSDICNDATSSSSVIEYVVVFRQNLGGVFSGALTSLDPFTPNYPIVGLVTATTSLVGSIFAIPGALQYV